MLRYIGIPRGIAYIPHCPNVGLIFISASGTVPFISLDQEVRLQVWICSWSRVFSLGLGLADSVTFVGIVAGASAVVSVSLLRGWIRLIDSLSATFRFAARVGWFRVGAGDGVSFLLGPVDVRDYGLNSRPSLLSPALTTAESFISDVDRDFSITLIYESFACLRLEGS